jgi:hypothetical protein
LLAACQQEAADPLAEVRQVVDELVVAVEEGETGTILSRVAFEFRTEDGLAYPDVQSIVQEYLIPQRTIGARLESADVRVGDGPDEIRVDTRVRFARGTKLRDRSLPPPPSSTVYAFELWFRKIDGEWRAVRGRYGNEGNPS